MWAAQRRIICRGESVSKGILSGPDPRHMARMSTWAQRQRVHQRNHSTCTKLGFHFRDLVLLFFLWTLFLRHLRSRTPFTHDSRPRVYSQLAVPAHLRLRPVCACPEMCTISASIQPIHTCLTPRNDQFSRTRDHHNHILRCLSSVPRRTYDWGGIGICNHLTLPDSYAILPRP